MLYILSLVLIFAIGAPSSFAKTRDSECERHLQSALYTFVPEAQRNLRHHEFHPRSVLLIQKLEIPPDTEIKAQLVERWQLLAEKVHNTNWVEKLAALKTQDPQAYALFERKRTSPSSTVSGVESVGRAFALETWRHAEQKIMSWIGEGRDLDLAAILEINGTFAYIGQTPSKGLGIFRTRPIVHDFTSNLFGAFRATDVTEAMNALLLWYHGQKDSAHPVELATLFLQRFTTIHPFFNGNGRTGRLLADWILLKNGYPPLAYQESDVGVHRSWHEPDDKRIEHSLLITTTAVEASVDFLNS